MSQVSKKELTEMTKRISEVQKNLTERFNQIKESRKYSGEVMATLDESESNLLLANRLKTAAIDLEEASERIFLVAQELLGRFESSVRLGLADNLIKERGFPKATESLRESILLTDPELVDLRRAITELRPFREAVEEYRRAIRDDETTWRELTSAKYRKAGL